MGLIPNQRGSRTGGGTSPESLPVINNNNCGGISPVGTKKKWTYNLLPLFVVLVIIAEITFLGGLDVGKNAALVDTWADLFYRSEGVAVVADLGLGVLGGNDDRSFDSESESCEDWLEKVDSVAYSRDFGKNPILVSGDEKDWKSCDVGCEFEMNTGKDADATFGLPQKRGRPSILRSMESSKYYIDNNIDFARRKGYSIIMTTSLSSDVPVGYFSWAEYDIMAPVLPKTETALAAAFISNCVARNFRLQALEGLEKMNINIDSYGACHKNHDEQVDKVKTLKRYKFSLAFENSNEEDYVTEKFFQSLVAGAIPVVVGAPNIQDFAPSPGSLLHIGELSDVESVAKSMAYLANNPDAFNQSLRWKYEGPSDSFKALVDMASVHSSCRLCIQLATEIWEREEKSLGFQKRPCKCTRGSETVYHLYIRERGRFHMESIFLRSGNLTLEALEMEIHTKFGSRKHKPVWKDERPESIQGGDELKIYKIYPLGLTQRQALYTFTFKVDDFTRHVKNNPCAKFEVIFV